MEKVNEVLKQRGAVYGSYNKGVRLRAGILSLMEEFKISATGEPYTEEERVILNDVLMKIRRITVDPAHIDSWIDLAGYSSLIVDFLSGIEKCKDFGSES